MRISDWSSDVCSSDLSVNPNIILPMKTHSLLGKDHGYPTISVKATVGVIYIVRDPRDVVISAADHYGLTVDQAIEMMADKKARGRGTAGTTRSAARRVGKDGAGTCRDRWTRNP